MLLGAQCHDQPNAKSRFQGSENSLLSTQYTSRPSHRACFLSIIAKKEQAHKGVDPLIC